MLSYCFIRVCDYMLVFGMIFVRRSGICSLGVVVAGYRQILGFGIVSL